jgi:predicted GNAT family N-acyltransferase
MKDKGIVTSQVHARNDRHSCLSKYTTKLPNLDILENEIVSIPCGWWVTDGQRSYIVDCIKEFSQGLPILITTLTNADLPEYSELMYKLYNFKSDKQVLTRKSYDSIYLFKYKGVVVATCKLLVEEKLHDYMGHIEDVVTHPDYRNKGYGRYLVSEVVDIAINEFNCYKVVLSCKEGLENFYSKCGMNKVGLSMVRYRD